MNVSSMAVCTCVWLRAGASSWTAPKAHCSPCNCAPSGSRLPCLKSITRYACQPAGSDQSRMSASPEYDNARISVLVLVNSAATSVAPVAATAATVLVCVPNVTDSGGVVRYIDGSKSGSWGWLTLDGTWLKWVHISAAGMHGHRKYIEDRIYPKASATCGYLLCGCGG